MQGVLHWTKLTITLSGIVSLLGFIYTQGKTIKGTNQQKDYKGTKTRHRKLEHNLNMKVQYNFLQPHSFSLHKMLTDGLKSCQLLVDYFVVFVIHLNSHSDGTHSLHWIHCWASYVMLNFHTCILICSGLQYVIMVVNDKYWNFKWNKLSHCIQMLPGALVNANSRVVHMTIWIYFF